MNISKDLLMFYFGFTEQEIDDIIQEMIPPHQRRKNMYKDRDISCSCWDTNKCFHARAQPECILEYSINNAKFAEGTPIPPHMMKQGQIGLVVCVGKIDTMKNTTIVMRRGPVIIDLTRPTRCWFVNNRNDVSIQLFEPGAEVTLVCK